MYTWNSEEKSEFWMYILQLWIQSFNLFHIYLFYPLLETYFYRKALRNFRYLSGQSASVSIPLNRHAIILDNRKCEQKFGYRIGFVWFV